MREFDYQWKNIPSTNTEYNQDRVNEFLNFTKIDVESIKDKLCLDAGCGNGRYTFAMQMLGAKKVVSFDVSSEAIERCKAVNNEAFVFDIMALEPNPVYEFVLCWGVLHHLPDPRKAFSKVASQVSKNNGILHIMVYHKDTQSRYEKGRKIWKTMAMEERLRYCEQMVSKYGGDIHGWFDAFNPEYNWSFKEKEVKKWFEEEGFTNIQVITKHNINIRGQYKTQTN